MQQHYPVHPIKGNEAPRTNRLRPPKFQPRRGKENMQVVLVEMSDTGLANIQTRAHIKRKKYEDTLALMLAEQGRGDSFRYTERRLHDSTEEELEKQRLDTQRQQGSIKSQHKRDKRTDYQSGHGKEEKEERKCRMGSLPGGWAVTPSLVLDSNYPMTRRSD
eukprot:1158829-Prorocentrum_minimum.AAC.1